MRRLVAPILVLALSVAHAGDWTKPKDGVMTEKQTDSFLDAWKKICKTAFEHLADIKAHEKDSAYLIASMKSFDESLEKIKKDSGLAKGEYEWVEKETTDIYAILWVYESHLKPQLDSAVKESGTKLADAQKARDEVAAARKSGKRIMTPDEKADAKKSADEQVAQCEGALKDAKQSTADAQKQLDEAKAALRSADADGKADAEQVVKDRQDGVKAAKDAEAEAQKNLEVARRRASAPDVPQTPEEKEQNDKDLADREQRATEELDQAKAGHEMITKTVKDANEKMAADIAKYPAKNVALVRPRLEKIHKLFTSALTMQDPDAPPAK